MFNMSVQTKSLCPSLKFDPEVSTEKNQELFFYNKENFYCLLLLSTSVLLYVYDLTREIKKPKYMIIISYILNFS